MHHRDSPGFCCRPTGGVQSGRGGVRGAQRPGREVRFSPWCCSTKETVNPVLSTCILSLWLRSDHLSLTHSVVVSICICCLEASELNHTGGAKEMINTVLSTCMSSLWLRARCSATKAIGAVVFARALYGHVRCFKGEGIGPPVQTLTAPGCARARYDKETGRAQDASLYTEEASVVSTMDAKQFNSKVRAAESMRQNIDCPQH